MSLFITGSESFIGREVIRQLTAAHIPFVGADITASGPDKVSADIRSADICDVIPEGATALIHLAALSRDADCRDAAIPCFTTNVMGTLNLMEAAKKRKVKQFIFASTEWVYDSFDPEVPKRETDPIDCLKLTSEYALSKLTSEANLRQAHLRGFIDTTILRFGIIYGPRRENWSAVESLTNHVLNSDTVTIGSKATARAFVHVADIATGIRNSIGLKGLNTLNLQGERLVPLGEVIEAAKSLTGRSPAVIETNPDKPSIRNVSAEAARRLIDWAPTIGIAEGIKTILPVLRTEESR